MEASQFEGAWVRRAVEHFVGDPRAGTLIQVPTEVRTAERLCYRGAVEPSDEALAQAWKNGDARAGEQLFDRYFKPVSRFFRNKSRDDTADLVQRTFLACVEALPRFRGDGSFRSFLFAIAYRQLCTHYKKQKKARERFDPQTVTVHDLGPSPTQLLAKRQEQRVMLAALRRIPLVYQTLLELHYWEKMPAHECAAVLGIPVGTAKSRIRRGRQLLEQQIATVADNQELLASTMANLEDWARAVREQRGKDAV